MPPENITGIFVIVYKMKHSSAMTEMVLTLHELRRQHEGKRQPRAVKPREEDDNLKLDEIV